MDFPAPNVGDYLKYPGINATNDNIVITKVCYIVFTTDSITEINYDVYIKRIEDNQITKQLCPNCKLLLKDSLGLELL